MTVSELDSLFEKKYPKATSCEWDNDGIMVCSDVNKEVKKVLVALDGSMEVINHAVENGFDTVITHHPLIFRKMDSLMPKNAPYRRAINALRGDISVLSYHTRLDFGEGGVNDTMAKVLGYSVDKRVAIDDEMTASVITLEREMTSRELTELAKDSFASVSGECSVRCSCDRIIKKVALVAGAAKNFNVDTSEFDAVLTGESSYNFTLDAAEENLAVIEIGHFESEFPVCFEIADLVRSCGISCEVMRSRKHFVI